MNNQETKEKERIKQKPRLFIPLFNTMVAVGFIVLMTFITIEKEIHILYLILVIVFMVIFVSGTWVNQFIFKKRNKAMTKDFEEETELLFKAIYELKKGTYIESIEPLYFDILDEYANIDKVTYNLEKRQFEPTHKIDIFLNMSTSCSGLMFDYNTLLVKSFEGMSPYSIWRKRKIILPTVHQGSLRLKMEEHNKMHKLTMKILNDQEMYYDSKQGIFLIGELNRTNDDESIQIGENVIVSLLNKEIKAVYVLIDKDLFKKRK